MIDTYRDSRPSVLERGLGVLYGPWGVAILVLVVTGVRLGMLSPAHGPSVMPCEVRPWLLGLSPRPGYADAAPLLPWLLGLISQTCGSASPCLRLLAPITQGLITWMMYLLGRRLFDARTGFWAALTYATLPMVFAGGLIVDDMALVLLAWAVGLQALARLTHPALLGRGGAFAWIVLGACVGLGLLAHPVMLVFVVAAALYLAVSPEFRRRHVWAGLGAAVLTAVALQGPLLAWNAANDWIGYKRFWSILIGVEPDPWVLARAIAVGVVMFGPVLSVALMRAMVRLPVELRAGAFADYRVRLLVIFTTPVLLMTLGLALNSDQGAWVTAPTVVAACLLVVGWSVVREAVAWLRGGVIVNLVLLAALTNGLTVARDYGWVPPPWSDPLAVGRGWEEAGTWLRGVADAYPDVPIGVAGEDASMVIYHARAQGVLVREVGAGPDAGASFSGLLVMPEALAEDGGDIRARLSVVLDDGQRRAWAAVMVVP